MNNFLRENVFIFLLYILLTRKICNILKNFELHQFLMHNFLCQNASIFPFSCLLQEEWTHCSTGAFWSGDNGTFWAQNYARKIISIHKYFLNYSNFLWISFYAKLCRNPYFACYSNYLWLDSPNFMLLPNPLFIFDLVCITRTNLILWSNYF